MSMQPSIQSAFLPQIAIDQPSTESRSLKSISLEPGSVLTDLPETLPRHQVAIVLQQLTEIIDHLQFEATEAEQKQFVQWALRQSYSDELTPVQKMELLNLGWQIQKVLWA